MGRSLGIRDHDEPATDPGPDDLACPTRDRSHHRAQRRQGVPQGTPGRMNTMRAPSSLGRKRRQSGAAVLMALFVATLATLIVTGLFWSQFVLLRTIENQQLVSQSRLLLRGALDWARAILREDALRSNFDALTEPWAQPLAETRLDQLGETSALASQASIAGGIEDAQARLNLRNLVSADLQIVRRELLVLRRLAQMLGVPEQTADLIALRMQQSLTPVPTGDGR